MNTKIRKISAISGAVICLAIASRGLAIDYEQTIAQLLPLVELRSQKPGRNQKITEIVGQWDGHNSITALKALLTDLSSERFRHQAQAWMFRMHAVNDTTKGDLLAILAAEAPTDDQRRRLLLLGDSRYAESSPALRAVLVNNLDDPETILESESPARWPIRNWCQSVISEYLSAHDLINEENFPRLSPYMDPAYEEDAIVRTKALIAAHPEHFPQTRPPPSAEESTKMRRTPDVLDVSPPPRKVDRLVPESEPQRADWPVIYGAIAIATVLSVLVFLTKTFRKSRHLNKR